VSSSGSVTHESRATVYVRRLAGEVVLALLEGPATSHQLGLILGATPRSMFRAIREIETWGPVLKVSQPPRTGVRGALPYVYELAVGWRLRVLGAKRDAVDRAPLMAAISLAIEHEAWGAEDG